MQEAVACHLRCVARRAPGLLFSSGECKSPLQHTHSFAVDTAVVYHLAEPTFTRGNKSHGEECSTSWGSQMFHTKPPDALCSAACSAILQGSQQMVVAFSAPHYPRRRQGPSEWWLNAQILEPTCLSPKPSSAIY